MTKAKESTVIFSVRVMKCKQYAQSLLGVQFHLISQCCG